jgi:hypothetical protein
MDQNEARAVSDAFVKENSLIELYDEVVIPALAMAEQDRHQGLLQPTNEAFIYQSIDELIVELAEYPPKGQNAGRDTDQSEKAAPEIVRHTARVICVAANDRADDITASMLFQIVEQAGYLCTYLPAFESAIEICELLSGDPDDIVCICALPPFALLHARTLSKRLRTRFPELKVIVGIWNASEGGLRVKERLGKAFADTVVTTLKEVVAELQALTDLDQRGRAPSSASLKIMPKIAGMMTAREN